MKRRPTIALDFDGVIHRYSKGWHNGTCYDIPMPGTKRCLKYLSDRFNVCIFSTRDPIAIVDWFAKHLPEFPTIVAAKTDKFWNTQHLIGVFKHKPVATVYIDDRAVRFDGWDEAIGLIEAFIRKEEQGE
jgi:hypothetical protein